MRSRFGFEPQLAIGDRVAVWIVRREAELRVDLRLELLGERVLETVGLGVHLVERHPQPVGEVALEQAVVAEHLEGALAGPSSVSATPWYGARSTSPSSARRFVIAVADGALTPIRLGERRRRHALARGLEGDRSPSGSPGRRRVRSGVAGPSAVLSVHYESDLVMTKSRLTRRRLLAAAAPLAAAPLVGKLAFDGTAEAGGHDHAATPTVAAPASHIQPGDDAARIVGGHGSLTGHAAMIGRGCARGRRPERPRRPPLPTAARCPRSPGACASTR